MAISGQQNINIGQPNSPVNSDSLYTAFTTIQNNFDQLFQRSSPITSIVAGQGLVISNAQPNSYSITNTGVISLVAGRNVTITTLTGTPGSNGTLVINSTGTGGNGGGTVDSVGVTSSTLVVNNSPITTSGNIDVELLPIAGVAGSYRSANITVDGYGRITTVANGVSSGTVTSVGVAAGNGIAVGGSPVTTSGVITVTNTGVTSIVAGSGITINQSNGAVTINSTGGGNGGSGTVTRVSVASNTLSVTGSPIVSSGIIDIELPANLITNVLTANAANIGNIISNQLQINAANTNVGITLSTAGSTANTYGIVSKKSRGTTSTPTTALSGDTLLNIQSQAYTQFSKYQNGGSFEVVSNGLATSGSSYVPTIASINSTGNTGIQYSMTLDDRGNLVLPGRISSHIFSNVSNPGTYITSRARGLDEGNITGVQVGDTLVRNLAYGYTGNGSVTIDDIAGLSYAGGSEIVVSSLPISNGQFIPSNYVIKTINTGNTTVNSTFTSAGNLNIVGSYVGSKLQLSSSNSSTGATITSASNTSAMYGYVSQKARGTISLPTPAQTGDTLLNIQSQGYPSFNTFNNAGYIQVVSNGVASSNSDYIPSIISLNSTSDTGLVYSMLLDNNGNVIIPGRTSQRVYSNVSNPGSSAISRARGTDSGNIAIVQAGDTIERTTYFGYSGNGTTTVDGVTGWAYAGGIDVRVVSSPASGGNIPSSFAVNVINNSGALLTSTFDNNGNLTIPAAFNGTKLTVSGNANVGGLETTLSATANTTATVTATIPIVINGVTYKIMLTT